MKNEMISDPVKLLVSVVGMLLNAFFDAQVTALSLACMEKCNVIFNNFSSRLHWQVAVIKSSYLLKMIMQILNSTMIWEINSSSFAFPRSLALSLPVFFSANSVE